MRVVLSLAGEIGIDFDDMADIDDEQEGRIAVLDGERSGIVLGLAAGGEHHLVPAARAATGVAELAFVAVRDGPLRRCAPASPVKGSLIHIFLRMRFAPWL